MRKLLAAYLIAAGLTMIALGKKLAGNDRPGNPGQGRRPGQKTIDLPRRHYCEIRPGPGRWETWRLGLTIIFGSLRFGLTGV